MKNVITARRTQLHEAMLVVLCLEVSYAILTRLVLPAYSEGAALEVLITVARGISAFIYWRLFREVITNKAEKAPRYWWLIVSLIPLCISPVLVGNYNLPDMLSTVTFVLTSFVVAIREEFAYRGVVQSKIQEAMGFLPSLFISNAFFVLYHIGAQPLQATYVVEQFVVGCIYGIVFVGTGSILPAIALHGVYDAIYCVTPVLWEPFPREVGSVLQIISVLGCALWLYQWKQQNKRGKKN